MARNPKNSDACELLLVAISMIKRNGYAKIKDPKALTMAYKALTMEPPPCPDDCLWAKMERPQKCACCCRNRHMKDLYERG